MKSLQESVLSGSKHILKELDNIDKDLWINKEFVKHAQLLADKSNKQTPEIPAWDFRDYYTDAPQWRLRYIESEKCISVYDHQSSNEYYLTQSSYYRMKELYEFNPQFTHFRIQKQGPHSSELRIFVEERTGWKISKSVVFTFSILKKNNELVLFNTEILK